MSQVRESITNNVIREAEKRMREEQEKKIRDLEIQKNEANRRAQLEAAERQKKAEEQRARKQQEMEELLASLQAENQEIRRKFEDGQKEQKELRDAHAVSLKEMNEKQDKVIKEFEEKLVAVGRENAAERENLQIKINEYYRASKKEIDEKISSFNKKMNESYKEMNASLRKLEDEMNKARRKHNEDKKLVTKNRLKELNYRIKQHEKLGIFSPFKNRDYSNNKLEHFRDKHNELESKLNLVANDVQIDELIIEAIGALDRFRQSEQIAEEVKGKLKEKLRVITIKLESTMLNAEKSADFRIDALIAKDSCKKDDETKDWKVKTEEKICSVDYWTDGVFNKIQKERKTFLDNLKKLDEQDQLSDRIDEKTLDSFDNAIDGYEESNTKLIEEAMNRAIISNKKLVNAHRFVESLNKNRGVQNVRIGFEDDDERKDVIVTCSTEGNEREIRFKDDKTEFIPGAGKDTTHTELQIEEIEAYDEIIKEIDNEAGPLKSTEKTRETLTGNTAKGQEKSKDQEKSTLKGES